MRKILMSSQKSENLPRESLSPTLKALHAKPPAPPMSEPSFEDALTNMLLVKMIAGMPRRTAMYAAGSKT